MLKIKNMNLNNVIRQGDSRPREYQLDTGNLDLNLTNKSATIRLMTADFQGIGYETTATVSSENKISFSIGDVIPARQYRLEVTVDDYVFPSRATDGQFSIDPSSHGQEVNIINVIGKEEIVRDVKARVENELEPFLGEIEQAELDRQAQEEARVGAESARELNEQTRLNKDLLRDDKIAQMEADKDAVIANATVDSEVILARGGKATLGQRLDETTSQLAQKVGGGNKAELEDLSSTVLSAIEGGDDTSFNLLSIPQNGSVTPSKLSFSKPSKNLFDGIYVDVSFTADLGGYIQHRRAPENTGKMAVIPIEPNESYVIKKHQQGDRFRIGVMNTEPTFTYDYQRTDSLVLVDDSLSEYSFHNTNEGKFLLVQVSYTGQKPTLQVEIGETPTLYTERNVIPASYIDLNELVNVLKGEIGGGGDVEMYENILIKKNSATESFAGELITILDTTDDVVIDSLMWLVSGAGTLDGVQLRITLADGGLYNTLDRSVFRENTPKNIRDLTSPQWHVLEFDTSINKFAFDLGETPFHCYGGVKVELVRLAGFSGTISYTTMLKGRKVI